MPATSPPARIYFGPGFMDEVVDDILLQYPGIILNRRKDSLLMQGKGCFVGNVQVQGKWYRITANCPQFPSMLDMHLRLQTGLRIANFTSVSAGVQPHWTFNDLIEHLPKLMPSTSPKPEECHFPIDATATNLYAEIADLNSGAYSVHINEAVTRIRFSKFKEHFGDHYLELELPSLQLLDHSLADCEGISWPTMFSKCTSLTALLQQFVNYLEELREFYAQFTDIDELCHVVQPTQPSTKHNWRLFLLRDRVFLKLSIADPFAPASSMLLHIIGPTYEVEELRRCYSEGLKNWDVELDIHKNLLRIFDLCFFPMPPRGDEVSGSQQVAGQQLCNICYSYELEGQVPFISCDNRRCPVIYHAACLRQWFNTLSDGKTFLDVSLGTCPFCKTKLSTSFTELLQN